MSFILDALRKSESERQRDAAPGLVRMPLATTRRRTPVWTWLVIGMLSIALVAVSGAWWLRGRDATGDGAIAAATSDFGSGSGSGGVAMRTPLPTAPSTSTSLTERSAGSGPAATGTPTAAAQGQSSEPDVAAETATPRPIDDLYAIDPALPRYRLTLLQFNRTNPAEGSAWVNGTRYYPGQRIDGGPQLAGVRSDGAVLAYRGQLFLLTAR